MSKKILIYKTFSKIFGIKPFDKQILDSKTMKAYIYCDIEESRDFYIRISEDGWVFCEYDQAEPGPIIRRDTDIVLGKIPKEVAKSLCYHLDLIEGI